MKDGIRECNIHKENRHNNPLVCMNIQLWALKENFLLERGVVLNEYHE